MFIGSGEWETNYPGKEKSSMGYYVNPSAESFAAIMRSGIYVDKSGLIAYMNKVVQTDRMLVCSSRPRRFGKSFAAKMLAAYYSRGADARDIFQNLKIAKEPSCENLNQYDVIFLDITLFLSIADTPETVVREIQKDVIEELNKEFPGAIQRETESLLKALMQVHTVTGRKFFIIIDEWDALFREVKQNTEIQKEYIQLLRSLFKNNITPQIIAGAYMTGILPIKKYGTQSALTDFREYTMLEPGPLAPFVGFTEEEVKKLCERYPLDFEQAKRWYDGYVFEQAGHIYSPNSIIEAIQNQNFANYWTQTETYESLMTYMDLNFDGLKDSVIDMIGGMRCKVDVGSFQNDMTSLKSKDDVLTLFVHLGYLAYDRKTKEVFIPNEEIREEFIRSVKNGNRRELVKAVELSDKLLNATIRKDEATVAELIEEAHAANTSPKFYNNEQALRSVVIMAYLSSVDDYCRFEELASGKGYIDLLFLPTKQSAKPALVIELKWNKSGEKAIRQGEEQQYWKFAETFRYKGPILLVGINYSTKTKKHTCRIKEVRKELS